MKKKTIPPEAVSRKIKNLRTQNLQIKSQPIQKITELPAAAIPGRKRMYQRETVREQRRI